jgi:hypothetical protein
VRLSKLTPMRLQLEKLEDRRLLAAVCSSGRDNFTVGLVACTEDAYEGYTLVAPDRSDDAFLVDVHGRLVNAWQNGPYSGRRGSYLGEDGSLYSSGTIPNPAQAAGGVTGALYIQDWDGNITWNFNYSDATRTLHHDLEVMPNGNVLAFAWVEYSAAEMIALGRDPATIPNGELWGERIVELEPTGLNTANVVWEWNLVDHLIQDFDATKANFGVVEDHPARFDANIGAQGGSSDWVHFNAIDYNPVLDQVLVNSPFMGEFFILDHSTTTAEAATSAGGKSGKGGDFLYRWGNPGNYGAPGASQMFNQHDAQWIDTGNPGEGNFLIFNNQAIPFSTVIEVEPPVIDAMGNYAFTPGMAYEPAAPTTIIDTGVNAAFISGAHRLPNGNTMFIHGPDGIIGEMTPTGEQVWEYVSPIAFNGITNQGDAPFLDNVFKSRRYAPSFSGFDGRDLTPTGYVENWTLGDYDLNGNVDATDLDLLCGGLHTNDRIYDLDFDDVVDGADIEEMVTGILGTIMGDANLDNTVDGQDFLIWNDHKFQPSNGWSEGDFNCDGTTDGQDFIIWNENKFTSADGSSPLTVGLAASVEQLDHAVSRTPIKIAIPPKKNDPVFAERNRYHVKELATSRTHELASYGKNAVALATRPTTMLAACGITSARPHSPTSSSVITRPTTEAAGYLGPSGWISPTRSTSALR